MVLSLYELNGLSGVYKINYPNGKIYIGCSCDMRRRMYEHNNVNKAKAPCDLAIKKYGKVENLEILELIPGATQEELKEREIYWIDYYHATDKDIGYNLTPGGDASGYTGEDNAQSVFTNDQVLDIRRRRFLGERKKDVYQDYQDFSFSTFEHIWLGRGYPNIGQEFLIPTNSKSRAEYSSEANKGIKNGRAKCTEQDVKEIRRLYEEEHLLFADIAKFYPDISKSSIRRIALRESYKDVE